MRWSRHAGGPFRSASPWRRKSWKAFCVRTWVMTAAPFSTPCPLSCCRYSTAIRFRLSWRRTEWLEARRELARRLDLIGIHAVKFAKDVPEPFAESYFALMPIHEQLRGHDYQTIRNYLRVTACNIHAEFEKRADIAALVEGLRSSAR